MYGRVRGRRCEQGAKLTVFVLFVRRQQNIKIHEESRKIVTKKKGLKNRLLFANIIERKYMRPTETPEAKYRTGHAAYVDAFIAHSLSCLQSHMVQNEIVNCAGHTPERERDTLTTT